MGASLLAVLVPSLLPALTDGVRGIFSKLTGGAGGLPTNVNERIQLMQAETERLKALAEVDKASENVSLWVSNTRAIFRYAAITGIWILTGVSIFTPEIPNEFKGALLDLSGATMLFIVGERFYFKIK